MQLLKKILAQNRKCSWRIKSKSEPGKFHVVFWSEMYGFECGKNDEPDTMDCIAFQMSGRKKNCRHIEEAKQKFAPKGRNDSSNKEQRTMIFQDDEEADETKEGEEKGEGGEEGSDEE